METITDTDNTTAAPPQMKKCLFCAEMIQAEAIKCRFCGEFLNTDKAKALTADQDEDVDTDQADQEPAVPLFVGRPSLWSMTGAVIKGTIMLAIVGCVIVCPIEYLADGLFKLELGSSRLAVFTKWRVIAGFGFAAVIILTLLIKMIKLKTVRYDVFSERIEWSRGIFDRRVDNLDMFRVVDMRLRRSLFDCIIGIGTVTLITTDKTDPEFVFRQVRKPRQLYDVIKNASLEEDRRNSVIHLE